MKQLFYVIFIVLISQRISAQTAYVQVANCSADSALSEVDVWLDTIKISNNLSFRNATSMLTIAANINGQVVSICPANSTDTTSALLQDSITFEVLEYHQLLITGFVSTGYNPAPPIALSVKPQLRLSASQSDHSDFWFFNAASDFGKASVSETSILNDDFYLSINFDSITDYHSIEGLNYKMRLRDSTDKTFREFEFDLAAKNLRDSAFTLILSGFANTQQNNNGASIRLDVAPISGGPFEALDISMTEVQFINNSTDPALSTIDLYVNGNQVVDNLKFRHGTDFLQLPSGVVSEIVTTPGTASSIGDSVSSWSASLDEGDSYVSVIQGHANASLPYYRPIKTIQFKAQREASTGSQTKYIVVNGIPDADEADISETSTLNTVLLDQLPYDAASDYDQIAPATYEIELLLNQSDVATKAYTLNLLNEGGQSQTWILSGLADTSISDSTNSAGIWVLKDVGGPLKELSDVTTIEELASTKIDLYPNPSSGKIYVKWVEQNVAYEVYGLAGNVVAKGHTEHDNSINLDMCEPGHYVVRLISNRRQFLQPVVIVR